MNIRDKFIEELKDMLKRNDIQNEIKTLFKPVIELFLSELTPFIYISLIFVIISFLLTLAIFIMVLRNKTLLKN